MVPSKHPFIGAPGDASYEPHRVLFFSPRHDRNLEALPHPELTAVLNRIRDECAALLKHDAVQSVYAFQASGPLFGGSVSHPHLQVLGFPFVPTKLVLDASRGCPLCVDFGDAGQVISTTADFTLAVPPWSRLPYEMVIAPNRHRQSLDECDTAQVAVLLSRALRAAKTLVLTENTPYTINFMTAPSFPARGGGKALHIGHHLRVEILPFATAAGRVRQIVAIESGAGLILNPVPPADAADRLRRVVERGAIKCGAEDERP
ncbi:hypothetical protein ACGFOM_14275 [Streptomyces sp. NPDC048594]|uniref:hypothetical protein n=1 Tax=Streptomyces sp. NPDC048594 TaxID=3365575 RepID=UPI003711662B